MLGKKTSIESKIPQKLGSNQPVYFWFDRLSGWLSATAKGSPPSIKRTKHTCQVLCEAPGTDVFQT